MAFLLVVLALIGWSIAVLGMGLFIHGLIMAPRLSGEPPYKREIEFTVVGFLGLMGFSVLAGCLNFFVPMGTRISLVLMTLGWGLMIAKRRTAFAWLNRSHVAVCAMIFGYVCLVPLTPMENYDTGLYHWPNVKWLIQEPLVLGLANLNGNFGLNSLWYPLVAAIDILPKHFSSPNFISNSLAMFFYGVGAFLSLKSFFGGARDLSNLFMAWAAVPWLWKVRDAMNSPSPDLPVLLLILLIFYLLILSLERLESRSVCLILATILSGFAVSIKLVAAPLLPIVGGWCLVHLWSVRSRTHALAIIDQKAGFGETRNPIPIVLSMVSSVLVVWVFRGILLSGCPVYPSTIGCMPGLKWAVSPESARNMSLVIQAWARSPGPGFRKSLNNFNWVPDWLMRNAAIEVGLIVLLVLGICLLTFVAVRHGTCRANKSLFLVPALIALSGVFFCLSSAPAPRYAYGYLFSLAILLLCGGVLSLQSILSADGTGVGDRAFRVLGILVLGLSLIALLSRKDIRDILSALVFTAGSIFGVLSAVSLQRRHALFWIFSVALLLSGDVSRGAITIKNLSEWGHFPYVTAREKVTSQGFIVREPVGTDQCWDTPLPCVPHVPNGLGAEKTESGRYRMFWKQKE
jgi:FtsH-binding integral membrane protein